MAQRMTNRPRKVPDWQTPNLLRGNVGDQDADGLIEQERASVLCRNSKVTRYE